MAKTESRQTRWQRKQLRLGNCCKCGKPRGEDGSPKCCASCLRNIAKSVSAYRRKQKRLDNCPRCGQPRGKSGSRELCSSCLLYMRLYRRKQRGGKPWRPGGPGCPPLECRTKEVE